jgi:glycosyltransferase involved in cell wall biosynthesis
LEVIVVDDGSTDEGLQIAAGQPMPSYQASQCRSRSSPKPGAAGADDSWALEYLESNIAMFTNSVSAVTCCLVEYPEMVSSVNLYRNRGIVEGASGVDPAGETGMLFEKGYSTSGDQL